MVRRVALVSAFLVGVIALLRRLTGAAGSAKGRHRTEGENAYRSAKNRVLILGAGFGGLATALGLDRRLRAEDDTSVLVVDRDTALLFTPLLWTVADGRSEASDVVVPVRAFQRGRDFHVLHAEVERIDLDRREVATSAGPQPYDVLVVALGSVTAVPDLPGLREHARLFHTPADAIQLRNHLIDAIEAAHRTENEAERREWLTFVVGGGGDTGIELAATIHDYLTVGLLREYPWVAEEPVRIVVVGRAGRLVPMSKPETSAAVERVLEGAGIEVLTGVAIEAVSERCVTTSAGEIPARTLFWAAGISAPDVVRDLPVKHARNGAVIVDEHLRVPGRPEVYVIGDAAWAFDAATGDPVPPTAQAATHQGDYVASAIAARLAGTEVSPFHFRSRGHLALLGSRTGVARVGPVTLTGLPAWLLWHGYYLARIPAWRNRLHLLVGWLLVAVTGRETAQLRLGTERSRVEARGESRGAS